MTKWKWILIAGMIAASTAMISCASTAAEQAREIENQRLAVLEESLKTELADQISDDNAEVYRYGGGTLVVSLNEKFLFDGESAVLKDSLAPRLIQVANILKQAPEKIIRVVGHTAVWDSKIWASSWELGAQRAVNIVRFLQDEAGIDPDKLVVETFGEYQPVAHNNSEAGRKKNRRVEFILMDREIFDVRDLKKMNR